MAAQPDMRRVPPGLKLRVLSRKPCSPGGRAAADEPTNNLDIHSSAAEGR